jgi:hypothetical protein
MAETKTILVEARRDRNVKPILDALAAECYRLGYRVKRWRGPLSGRVPYRRRLSHCELAIIFNGAHPAYQSMRRQLENRGCKRLYVELGWFPQSDTFQIDPAGINSTASWASEPLQLTPQDPLEVRSSGDLLVLLQDDEDTQITQRSPWFADMHEFLRHILEHSSLPVRVRPHPRHPKSDAVASLISNSDCRLDRSPSLSAALLDCRAVACLNSSSAVETLVKHIPVLCYGNAIYRHPGVVHCLRDDGAATRIATDRLATGLSGLYTNQVDEFLGRVQQQQWRLESIPRRLPSLLRRILSDDNRNVNWHQFRHLRNAG